MCTDLYPLGLFCAFNLEGSWANTINKLNKFRTLIFPFTLKHEVSDHAETPTIIVSQSNNAVHLGSSSGCTSRRKNLPMLPWNSGENIVFNRKTRDECLKVICGLGDSFCELSPRHRKKWKIWF